MKQKDETLSNYLGVPGSDYRLIRSTYSCYGTSLDEVRRFAKMHFGLHKIPNSVLVVEDMSNNTTYECTLLDLPDGLELVTRVYEDLPF